MLICSNSKSVPAEYRKAAEALFPGAPGEPCCRSRCPSGSPGKVLHGKESAAAFADLLGIGGDFRRILEAPREEIERFMVSFQNNLDLLIQKTWVEKADEDRKEKLQNRIPAFISLIKGNEYIKALEEFSVILEELAWLLFGPQSRKDDFFEYTFRIDCRLGLFWWYSSQIERFLAGNPSDGETLRAVLVLGLCYLTGF
jgi:hypothetical protein